LISLGPSLSVNPTAWIYSKGNTLNFSQNREYGKIVFGIQTGNISETAEDRAKVTINCLHKVHALSIATKCMTLKQ